MFILSLEMKKREFLLINSVSFPPKLVLKLTLVLSAGSAVFDAMFNGDMRHTEAEIIITDIESPAFLVLLRFLYSDESDIGPENVMTTLYTAKKYAVPA